MNFEVNGTQYFLNFNPGEGEWILLTPTATGVRRLEVLNDRPPIFQVLTVPQPGDGLND